MANETAWPGRLLVPSGDEPRINITPRRGISVFSGGSAANNLVDTFNDIAEQHAGTLSYIIPISDNGGSTSELIRVLGGPGIGDLRSRLVRLIPDSDDPGSEAHAIKALFNHRLPDDGGAARQEWLDIVEVQHSIWYHISSPKKELIRSFLITVNLEIVKRLRPSSRFDFSKASIGNLFITGARLFTGSLESAIYLLSSICAVPSSIAVLPAINTNFSHHISATLADGTVIAGQNNISHPSTGYDTVPGHRVSLSDSTFPPHPSTEDTDRVEDANLPGTLPTLRASQINFTKPTPLAASNGSSELLHNADDLTSRITHLAYISPYGMQIRLDANSRVLSALNLSSAVIYSIGSLYTSIIPSLILKGVGAALASSSIRSKILILNGTTDRETGPSWSPFTALDFVQAIADACCQSQGREKANTSELRSYVTHVIYLEGDGVPKVDRPALSNVGIETIKTYGRREQGEIRYDAEALRGALGMVLGRGAKGDRSRRNTMER
ncbi:hypothetical protein BDZ85DRAFT_72260 [Elsinoe ampelina]|uniref:Uncharacterized protein n=1 Tax=Elsinoe ampelina TaxID=302913 RepID=A0A6A6GJS7_9PEZI|nr:hypothetical protein BDZ85DRAFT_72260 [Elsinoe ampelina]